MTTWRYIAQRALTNEWLDWDVPFAREELSWALSGAGSLRGSISPEYARMRGRDGRLLLDEWSTYIYAEADGIIRWGGILVSSTFAGGTWSLEAAGFSTYPTGVPFMGELSTVSIDPTDAFRRVWADVQSQPDGNLGVIVDSTTTVPGMPAGLPLLPTEDSSNGYWDASAQGNGKGRSFFDVAGKQTFVDSPNRLGTKEQPYEFLWWNAPDCGQELDTLAQEGPFDYVEEHNWNGPASVEHRIRIGYPRLGHRRDDLAFVQGDNVIEVVLPERRGDRFSNEGIGIGAGEGRKALIRRIPERDGKLRRPFVYSDVSITAAARMDALVRTNLNTRRQILEIPQITVVNHPNATIGSWQLGDDILVTATVPWLGDIAIWHRITGWSLVGEDAAVLALRRTDSFSYGG